jgi:hypothetical protein
MRRARAVRARVDLRIECGGSKLDPFMIQRSEAFSDDALRYSQMAVIPEGR